MFITVLGILKKQLRIYLAMVILWCICAYTDPLSISAAHLVTALVPQHLTHSKLASTALPSGLAAMGCYCSKQNNCKNTQAKSVITDFFKKCFNTAKIIIGMLSSKKMYVLTARCDRLQTRNINALMAHLVPGQKKASACVLRPGTMVSTASFISAKLLQLHRGSASPEIYWIS